MTPPLRGIVLAGGRSSRLGGRHKPAIRVDGVPIVARAIAALREAGAEPLVVGEARSVPGGVPVVREDPPFAGPLAAVAAGLGALTPAPDGVILLLGGDMPFVTAATLARLAALAAVAAGGAAYAEGGDGRAQPLCAAWDEAVLRARLATIGDPANLPLRVLHETLDPARVHVPARELLDVDTPDDLREASRAPSACNMPPDRLE
ncbi:molybdenum cofactor guanylyltransferase [Microbacterium rhizophilus]|uniref:molybdenum cofactor guanylyltransferase n=1 Tax=Microbacterium rhizophilus TaxID=3138934 RepID=UPI0031E4EC6B